MPGDADEPNESLLPGTAERLYCTVGGVSLFEFVLFDKIVQLNQIDLFDTEPLERTLEAPSRAATSSLVGLCCEKELFSTLGKPWAQPEFGVSVGGGGIEVVDAVTKKRRQERVGLILGHAEKSRSPENDPAARVTRAPERHARDHE